MTARPWFTSEERAAYTRDGFLVVRGLFPAATVERLSLWTEELRAAPEAPGRHWVYGEPSRAEAGRRLVNRIENFYPHHPGFRALIDGPELRGRAAELLGEPAVLFKDKINFKMPGGGGFEAHQDQQAGWTTYARLFLTALVSIDEATPENGCLELAPGQHTRGLIGQEWAPLSEADTTSMRFLPCPTRPGDVAFFDSYVPHRSAPNPTATARRVLYVTYNRASEGDQRLRYYADKHRSFPPDCEREPGREYAYRV